VGAVVGGWVITQTPSIQIVEAVEQSTLIQVGPKMPAQASVVQLGRPNIVSFRGQKSGEPTHSCA